MYERTGALPGRRISALYCLLSPPEADSVSRVALRHPLLNFTLRLPEFELMGGSSGWSRLDVEIVLASLIWGGFKQDSAHSTLT